MPRPCGCATSRATRLLPRRLLFVGLPLTIVAGGLLAHLVFPEAGWAAAALIATILAPTDTALGMAVVTNKAVPARIRRALNVESGLNDGIATPFVTLFIAVVAAEEDLGDHRWGLEALTQIGLAIVAAVVVGYFGGRLLALAQERGWTSEVSEQIGILALALLAYVGSVAIGGNGFVAAFAGGILFGAATKGRLAGRVQFTETLGLSATFLVWSVFGALFVGELLTHGTLGSTHPLRPTQPHRDQDGAGRDRADRHSPAARHRGVHGLVRPARAGLRRLHAARPGGDRTRRRRGRCSCRPSPGPSCCPSCCTASRPHHWPPGTAHRSARRATSRKRPRRASHRSGSATSQADTAPSNSGDRKRHEPGS